MTACLCADVTEGGTGHLEHTLSSRGPKPQSEHSVSFCKRQVVSEVEPTQGRLRAHRDVPDKAKGGGCRSPAHCPMVAPIWEDDVHVFSWGYVPPTNFIDKTFFHEMTMVVGNRL